MNITLGGERMTLEEADRRWREMQAKVASWEASTGAAYPEEPSIAEEMFKRAAKVTARKKPRKV